MRKTTIVTEARQTGDVLLLHTERLDVEAAGLRPRGHVLVDSDGFAFLYILETEQDFVYLSMPEAVWPQLKQALAGKQPVWADVNGVRMELEHLQEELAYLVENIEGNANYGDEFVSRVEAVFLA
ncbi:hypothetical protein [Ectobacillus ponti]|uniref:UPF0738 protein NK662_07170 n=1 Tax=Ectobacillus ponti TaxID=2961894 RepID=A0AA42BPD9_9BACI|nr:hypothetical protein [Ectobacillus ponti]MCP8968321.1 hypothetical protein [Ectobacillus ponti]